MEDKYGNLVHVLAQLTHNGLSTGLYRCKVTHAPGTENQATRTRILREEDILDNGTANWNAPTEPLTEDQYTLALDEADAY